MSETGGRQLIRYAARTAPVSPETVWMVEGDDLVETCGRRRRVFPLSSLSDMRVIGEGGPRRAAQLLFGRRRLLIPAQSLLATLRFQDRSGAFDAFIKQVEARAAVSAVQAKPPSRAARQIAQALVWTIVLTGAGALFLIVGALLSGFPDIGLALGARLLFVPILLSAALPWLLQPRR
ncbi:MAG: hypothetical protein J0I28_04320 [Caulobacterales bacterium]|nr:hypothetical protein [Caulobacterales bacterium]